MAGHSGTLRGAPLLVALATIFAGGCGTPTTAPSPAPSPVSSTPGSSASAGPSAATGDARIAGWRADLEALVPGIDRLHADLTHGTSREDLDAAVAALEATIASATDDELMVGVLRIVAMVSAGGCDAHTGAFIWGTGSYPVHSLPLRLWWFDDGIRIVDALDPYRDLIGARIDTIGGRSASDVVDAVEPLIPRDNDATVRLLMPRFLLMPEVLRSLGLLDPAPGAVALGLTMADGSQRNADVDPLPMADYNAWAGPYGLHLPADADVTYLSRIDDALWWERLPDAPSTLFIQENRVELVQPAQLAELRDALAGEEVQAVVLDLRHNFGGEVGAVNPFVALFEDAEVDVPGRLFVVSGRNTFSAASLMVARLMDRTDATLVGEPMGGCPTAYGDAEEFELPFSHIVVDVPTVLEVGVSPDDTRPTIQPELHAPLSFRDWRAGVDPALEAVAAASGAGP
jgi:hypothetical protein